MIFNKWATDIYRISITTSQKHYAEWKKSYPKEYILDIPFILSSREGKTNLQWEKKNRTVASGVVGDRDWLRKNTGKISFTNFWNLFLLLYCQYFYHLYYCLVFHIYLYIYWDFPGGSDGKASADNAGDLGSIPGSGRSPGEGNGNPLQYSCLENPMDGGT